MRDFKNEEILNTLNHSCAHVLAQAVKHLYPDAKFWVGPVVSEGFYYDIDLGNDVIKDEDIVKIEKEMKKICKDGKRIIKEEISKSLKKNQNVRCFSCGNKSHLKSNCTGLPWAWSQQIPPRSLEDSF